MQQSLENSVIDFKKYRYLVNICKGNFLNIFSTHKSNANMISASDNVSICP